MAICVFTYIPSAESVHAATYGQGLYWTFSSSPHFCFSGRCFMNRKDFEQRIVDLFEDRRIVNTLATYAAGALKRREEIRVFISWKECLKACQTWL